MFMGRQYKAGSWVHNFVGNWFVALLSKTIHYFVNRSQEFTNNILIIFSTKTAISHLQDKSNAK